MTSRRRQKIGAFLGMLAILLSMVAPTVSQVLRGAHADVHDHSHHGHHVMAVGQLAHAAHHAHHHGSDSSLLGDACPYCGLIAHSPALPGTMAISGVAPLKASLRPPVIADAFRPYTVLTPAQPRAPPAWS
ncbi:DUF2946 domain-containing protein [Burkholderia diffusa]|uniref:DUF2946 domain-containing protein n=1 Tax=Burkholderia diffusa TaxID=488732 RepID=UPI002652BFB8|nr:DUF2946 domain-containing protein [Burkholderia diffusa]MDN7907821.1 DUF2946 domain-containing protein [Burkholderia diffusa]